MLRILGLLEEYTRKCKLIECTLLFPLENELCCATGADGGVMNMLAFLR